MAPCHDRQAGRTGTPPGSGVATGVYAVSFGVLAVASRPQRRPDVRDVAAVFTGASQFAFVG